MSKEERTGWRDAKLSARHHAWGLNCPAVDIDFLMIEYDSGIARALVEYKNERAKEQDPRHASYRAIKDLADRAGIPFFVCRYATDFSWFKGIPLNVLAKAYLPERTTFRERGWVTLLYQIRGRAMPDTIWAKLG